MLTSYPPFFYAGSAHYLANCAVSISSRQLVMRRPLPILASIVSKQYLSGVFKHIKRPLIETFIINRAPIGELFLPYRLFNPLSLPLTFFMSTPFQSALAVSSIVFPITMGYCLWWDFSEMGLIYKILFAHVNLDLEIALEKNTLIWTHGLSHGNVSTPVGDSDVVMELVRTIEKAKTDIEHQSAVIMPTSNTPQQIGFWLAGILLAVVLSHSVNTQGV